ncbi:hypothetical protein LINPERPRIM_LOCUS34182 [Linum perenne]
MDSTEFLSIYDSCWFEMQIFNKTHSSSSSSESPPDSPTLASMYMQIQKQQISNPAPRRLNRSTMTRSISDDLYSKPKFDSGGSDSPVSVLNPHLSTILSGKEDSKLSDAIPTPPRRSKLMKGGDKKIEGSKSLTSLEFEELKGFMDLGFVFSEEDKDSRLVTILPGLQRLGKTEQPPAAVPRPYLSEAWAAKEERKKENKKKVVNPLMNLKVPIGNEVELKDSLRLWAHSVASAVR